MDMKGIRLALSILGCAPAAAQDGERLVYEIVVTHPGTRSQGWVGTIFGADGLPLRLAAGEGVDTPAGRFVSVECRELWVPCGMIHEKTLAWLGTSPGNSVRDGEPWSYRLFVAAEGSKSEGWRGEILHAGQAIPGDVKTLDTPMGPFGWTESPNAWGRHGWFHQAWAG